MIRWFGVLIVNPSEHHPEMSRFHRLTKVIRQCMNLVWNSLSWCKIVFSMWQLNDVWNQEWPHILHRVLLTIHVQEFASRSREAVVKTLHMPSSSCHKLTSSWSVQVSTERSGSVSERIISFPPEVFIHLLIHCWTVGQRPFWPPGAINCNWFQTAEKILHKFNTSSPKSWNCDAHPMVKGLVGHRFSNRTHYHPTQLQSSPKANRSKQDQCCRCSCSSWPHHCCRTLSPIALGFLKLLASGDLWRVPGFRDI